ncbi:MAG: TetR/AcrR family transcriptional regulator [Actinobacteria bacterium]|nr:MAG: TetR/AcrR family transcriptional regulator [Actinomycetota bacterium]
MTDRSIATGEKRRLILDAAVRVFARRGFHTSRVGDIAEEAGVSHGLLYHYFSSKDELLETIFRETWDEVLTAIAAVEASGEPAREQLRQVAKILLRGWQTQPARTTVIMREIARTPELQRLIADLTKPREAVERIIRRGQETGEFREDVDARLASTVFYGGIDDILTGWVLGLLPDGDEDVARAELTVVDVVSVGLAR